jgi:hypothetical protein
MQKSHHLTLLYVLFFCRALLDTSRQAVCSVIYYAIVWQLTHSLGLK